MSKQHRERRFAATARLLAAGLGVFSLLASACWPVHQASAEDLSAELREVSHKIVYETYRQGNWELLMVDADGSNPVNLTRTPDVDELYPHASPDGTKVCFVVDAGQGSSKTRSVYYMNLDGSGRRLVARGARQPCWLPDGTAVAYLKSELEEFSIKDYATKGLFVFDLATGGHRQHPHHGIHHLYNICYSPQGDWLLATVHAGMGYRHAILAIEAHGKKVFDLRLGGCRAEFSPDGKKIAWGAGDFTVRVVDVDLTGAKPRLSGAHDVVRSAKPMMIYHFDWSPDGKYIAFTRGRPKKVLGDQAAVVGWQAQGWNICVADAAKTNRWVAVTTDGNSNKEPDWVFVEEKETR